MLVSAYTPTGVKGVRGAVCNPFSKNEPVTNRWQAACCHWGGGGYTGTLVDYPVKKGPQRVLRGAQLRADDPAPVSVVIRWAKGRPEHRDGPWPLITDLGKKSAIALTTPYGRRMGLEEFFRDAKGVRNGPTPRHRQVAKADRMDRL